LRRGEQRFGEARRLQPLEPTQPLVFARRHHHRGGLAVLRHRLRLALRAVDQLAEAGLAVLNRPHATGHAFRHTI